MKTLPVKDVVRRTGKAVFTAADPLFGSFPGPRILIYHQIEAGLGRQMEVTKAAFVAQLDWMQRNGRIVDLGTALTERALPGSEETFVLTFDDGYQDFHRHGYPELVRRRLPFVLYLTTHPVESGESLTPGGGADPLTWGQIEEMAATGLMTLGAHTHRHRDLRRLTTDEVTEELEVSNDLIRRRMGIDPAHFAYPWGYWSATADEPVRRRYRTATLGSGPPVTAATDLALVHRLPVQLSDGVFFFTHKMRRGLRLEDKVRRRLTRYIGP